MPTALIGHGSPIDARELGRNWAALREHDISVLCSGNVVDNMRSDRLGWARQRPRLGRPP